MEPRLGFVGHVLVEMVAHFRDFASNKSLVALMNSILTELHLSPLARARL
jgi:hypothetical protein